MKDIKKKVYFLVNGSSNESEIQFYDENIELYKIGKEKVSFCLISIFTTSSMNHSSLGEGPAFVSEL